MLRTGFRIICFILLFSGSLFAQKQANWWYFGANAGLDFTSGSPVAVTNGQLNTTEGCATISDCDGNLLFYTDGGRVYNRNHTQMPNGFGLLGSISSTQSSIVVPTPGSTTLFYIFTASDHGTGGLNGICYSIVDMSLAGGLGDVTTKNTNLYAPASEKVTAVPHANGTDYWVVTMEVTSNTYRTFLVTAGGVTPGPTTSVGYVTANTAQSLGYLKSSHDFKKLAMAFESGGRSQIVDFDNATGVLSNPIDIPPQAFDNFIPPNPYGSYGVEFSPDDSRLYIAYGTSRKIYQFDISSGVAATIIASSTLIGTATAELGALQLAPDGKIYAATVGTNSLDVINNPNALGLACNFAQNGVSLAGRTSQLGLPNFLPDFYNPPVNIIINILANNSPVCPGGNDGTASVDVTGGSGTYTYTWSNGNTGPTAIGLTAGDYTVTVSGSSSTVCGNTASGSKTQVITVVENPPITPTLGATTASCGQANGTAFVTAVANGTGPYSYSWSNGNSGQTQTTLTSQDYTVTITDGGNCSVTATVAVPEPPPLSVTLTEANPSCGLPNGNIITTATGGTGPYDFLWSNGPTTQDITSLTPNTYILTVTDAWGCTQIATKTLTNSATLNINPTIIDVKCKGGNTGSISVLPTGATYSYTWSNGGTTSTIITLIANPYSVTVNESGGCSATAVFTVTEPPLALTANITPQAATCGGNDGSATVSVTGGTGLYTYVWDNSSTGVTYSGLGSGVYSVTVNDANACTTSSTVTINNSGGPTLTKGLITDVLCFGGNTGAANITISGGATPYNYTWSGATPVGPTTQTNLTFNTLTAQTYTLTVTDASTCFSTITVAITQPTAALAVTITSQAATCGGNDGAATVIATGGTGLYTYKWDNASIGVTYSGLASGVYSVTVNDGNACTTSSTVTISNSGGATLTKGLITDVLCFGGNTGAANITISGGTTPYNYTWSGATPVGPTTQTNLSFNTLTAQTYTLTVTDASTCLSTITVTITQPALPLTASINKKDATCSSADGEATVTLSNGSANYTYLWSNASTAVTSVSASATISNLVATAYSVLVTDGNGCTTTTAFNINNSNGVAITSINKTDVNCFGGNTGAATATISGGVGPYNYTWSNGAPVTTTALTLPNNALTAQSYTLTVTDLNNCQSVSIVTITQPSTALSIVPSATATTCGKLNGSIITIVTGGTASYQYLWSNGSTASSQSNLTANNYILTVTDAKNCTTVSTLAVSSSVPVVAGITASTTTLNISTSSSVTLIASGGGTYTWSPAASVGCVSCPVTSASPTQPTNYCVIVNQNSCADTACVLIDVTDDCQVLKGDMDLIPSAFSPNNDGVNDRLCVRQAPCIIKFKLQIFNRWGEKVFDTNNAASCWDGTFNGKDCNTATFSYIVNATTTSGKEIVKNGNVTLVR